MSTLSCHVLDTANGRPAQGIAVSLCPFGTTESREQAITNEDGRAHFQSALEQGQNYTLRFETLDYCQNTFGSQFFPVIDVHFHVADSRHYHVPVLLSPYSYSTYRGS